MCLVPSAHATIYFIGFGIISSRGGKDVRKLRFYLIVNYRKRFAMKNCNKKLNSMYVHVWNLNELQPAQSRLAHFSFSGRFFTHILHITGSVKCVCEIDTHCEWIWTSISRSFPFLHLCTVRGNLISFPIGKWLIVDNLTLASYNVH